MALDLAEIPGRAKDSDCHTAAAVALTALEFKRRRKSASIYNVAPVSPQTKATYMPSYKELQIQIAELQKLAEEVRVNELATVIADIKNKMDEFGITPADLGIGVKKKMIRPTASEPIPPADAGGTAAM
ncbi:MAG: H-NS histone family protein [Pseudomonadota bacterium]